MAENGLLQLLPQATVEILANLLESDAGALAATCRSFAHAIDDHPEFWTTRARAKIDGLEDVSFDGRALGAALSQAPAPSNLLETFLEDSVAAESSSIDQPSEAATNVLRRSLCARLPRRRLAMNVHGLPADVAEEQVRCGCALGRACYWSSAPSQKSDSTDWLSFSLPPGNAAVVTSFSVAPYAASWQPGAPTFSPRRVQLQLFLGSPQAPNATPYYSSQEYDFDPSPGMAARIFELPRPVMLLGASARVLLHGRAQRQTLEPHLVGDVADAYYVCISHVTIMAVLARGRFKGIRFQPAAIEDAAGSGATPVASGLGGSSCGGGGGSYANGAGSGGREGSCGKFAGNGGRGEGGSSISGGGGNNGSGSNADIWASISNSGSGRRRILGELIVGHNAWGGGDRGAGQTAPSWRQRMWQKLKGGSSSGVDELD